MKQLRLSFKTRGAPIIGSVCALLIAFVLLATSVFARTTGEAVEPIEIGNSCSLTLRYASDEFVFADEEVALYRVAAVTKECSYRLTGRFSDYPVRVDGILSADEWWSASLTLEAYIGADAIEPDYRSRTDAEGVARFEDIPCGLYLVSAVRAERDGSNYLFESFLYSVPTLDDEGHWVYHVEAHPKFVRKTPTYREIDFRVIKYWKDLAASENRPQSVSIDILKDGKRVDSCLLSSENDWSYRWSALDDGSVWSVVETNVPKGYVVNIEPIDSGDEPGKTTIAVTNSTEVKTGDSTGSYLLLIVLCLSGVLVLIIGGFTRRRVDDR